MKRIVCFLVVCCAAGSAFADDTKYTTGIASINITSPVSLPPIAVRNVAKNHTVDARELRVVSEVPRITVTGQVFCKKFTSAPNRLRAAQVMFGNPVITLANNGHAIEQMGTWGESAVKNFPGTTQGADISITTDVEFPSQWPRDALVTLGFNPVKEVEDRLKRHVQKGGDAAEFLRTDDVFEVPLPVNLAGWCMWEKASGDYIFPGYRQVVVTARIFYQGDAAITAPDRARQVLAPARGGDSQPPAKAPARATPARAATSLPDAAPARAPDQVEQ